MSKLRDAATRLSEHAAGQRMGMSIIWTVEGYHLDLLRAALDEPDEHDAVMAAVEKCMGDGTYCKGRTDCDACDARDECCPDLKEIAAAYKGAR